MEYRFDNLKSRDVQKAIQFAIKGMHFDWYMKSFILLQLYGRYFWYMEWMRATQVIALYAEDECIGVLLAEVYGEKRNAASLWKLCFVSIFSFLQSLFAKESAGLYDEINKQMYTEYQKKHKPDGEIIFFAVDPLYCGKGIGTLLLQELERREKGKLMFLYTDSACSYQFYEHKNFQKMEERSVRLKFQRKLINLTCMIYQKKLGDEKIPV